MWGSQTVRPKQRIVREKQWLCAFRQVHREPVHLAHMLEYVLIERETREHPKQASGEVPFICLRGELFSCRLATVKRMPQSTFACSAAIAIVHTGGRLISGLTRHLDV